MSPKAPKILTVILADTWRTTVAIVHENEAKPYVRRTVQIELTEDQRIKLLPQWVGENRGEAVYEEVLQCWLEPRG